MRTSIFLICLVFAAPVVADDHVAIVKEAFEAFSSDFHQEWAFTRIATEDELEMAGRYDPRQPKGERWQLLSINGRKPSSDESDEYRQDMADEFENDGEDRDDEIINYETLEHIETTEALHLYRFLPNFGMEDDDMGRKMLQHVEGHVTVARDGNYVQSIELRNQRTIRPVFSVKIKEFLTQLQFGPAAGEGPIVPLSVEVEVKGRAALLVKIEERESVHFTDYEHVGT